MKKTPQSDPTVLRNRAMMFGRTVRADDGFRLLWMPNGAKARPLLEDSSSTQELQSKPAGETSETWYVRVPGGFVTVLEGELAELECEIGAI